MFSPAKAITAGALVLGIGGLLLIAQPFEQRGSSAPGAASDDPAMTPSFFSGTTGEEWFPMEGATSTRRADGVFDNTGEGYTVVWDANDPRISGTASMIMNETDYREGGTVAPNGERGTIRTLNLRIVNDEGSWEGPLQFVVWDAIVDVRDGELVLTEDGEGYSNSAGWLAGAGAYEGLSAYVVWPAPGGGHFRGHITAEGPPSIPELPAE
jgi:hypothetical protein